MIRVFIWLLLLFPLLANGAILNSDGTASNTQTQINAAANGDTVLLPSSGSFTWTSGVSMPNTKFITLDLNGRTITLSGGSGTFEIEAHATGTNRITNGSIVKSGTGFADFQGPFDINDERGMAGVRVDHINFSITGASLADSVIIDLQAQGPGVMDNCTFTGMGPSYEFIHINGFGASDGQGWTLDSGNTLAGSGLIFYIEDCSFVSPDANANSPWIQAYYGSRFAIRHCTFDYVSIDVHGDAAQPGGGGRWWEIYENTWDNDAGNNHTWACSFRAGSGVIFNNSMAPGANQDVGIGLCEESSGWPADYQIGRGLNQTSDPAYTWNNGNIDVLPDECDALETEGMVQFNRDVFNDTTSPYTTRSGYTSYTYPHPLQGAADTTPPTITSRTISSNGTTWTFAMSETVDVIDGTGFTTSMSGGAVTLTYSSGSGSGTLTYTGNRTVNAGETGTLSYTTVANGIEDVADNDLASFSGASVTNNSTQGAAPTPSTATIGVNANSLAIVFSASVSVGAGGNGGLTLSMSGGAVTATYASGSGSSTLVYNLNRTLTFTESGTVSYTQPGNGIEATSGGSDVATFSSFAVVNGIDPARIVTWNPGVPGGITNRTTIFTTVSADTTGTTDAQPAIQAAINACPVGQVVYIPAGTYRLNSQLSLTKGITLRGAGPSSTTLNSYAVWHAIQFGNFPSAPVDTSVSGSPAKGATSFVVGSVSTPSISIGDYIVIDQINDGVNVINVDDQSRDGGTRLLSQILEVTNIAGTTLTFTPPLNAAFSAAQTPEVWELNQGNSITSGAGVEDLTVTRISPLNDFSYSNFKFVATVKSWVKNCVSNVPDFWHVDFDRSAWNTIEHSYFNDGNNHATGGQAYGVVAGNRSCHNLVQNNRFRRLRHSMVLKEGATGNVFAYNYSFDSYQADGWLATDMNPHGGHSYQNLFEGNCAVKAYADFTHGSSANNTYFRNWITRVSSLQAGSNARRVVDLEINQNNYNVFGNVLGSQSQTWTALETGATRTSGGEYVWSFGFGSDGDNTRDSTVPQTSLFRHANFVAITNTISYDSSLTNQTLPSSLYLSAKPSWFFGLTWPAYDPSTGASEAAVDIPAGYFHVNGVDPPGDGQGTINCNTLNVTTLRIGP